MSTRVKTELIEALFELADRYPNWRFGQLIANVAGWTDCDVWDVEDECLLKAAQGHLAKLASESTELRA
jgi:hypothetical protein